MALMNETFIRIGDIRVLLVFSGRVATQFKV